MAFKALLAAFAVFTQGTAVISVPTPNATEFSKELDFRNYSIQTNSITLGNSNSIPEPKVSHVPVSPLQLDTFTTSPATKTTTTPHHQGPCKWYEKVVTESGRQVCGPRKQCPQGYEPPSPAVIATLSPLSDWECERCKQGWFQNATGHVYCTSCLVRGYCPREKPYLIRNCSVEQDGFCSHCPLGQAWNLIEGWCQDCSCCLKEYTETITGTRWNKTDHPRPECLARPDVNGPLQCLPDYAAKTYCETDSVDVQPSSEVQDKTPWMNIIALPGLVFLVIVGLITWRWRRKHQSNITQPVQASSSGDEVSRGQGHQRSVSNTDSLISGTSQTGNHSLSGSREPLVPETDHVSTSEDEGEGDEGSVPVPDFLISGTVQTVVPKTEENQAATFHGTQVIDPPVDLLDSQEETQQDNGAGKMLPSGREEMGTDDISRGYNLQGPREPVAMDSASSKMESSERDDSILMWSGIRGNPSTSTINTGSHSQTARKQLHGEEDAQEDNVENDNNPQTDPGYNTGQRNEEEEEDGYKLTLNSSK
ncbi:uncharacterized protein LOC106161972 [Lingula anatina]|uniref:Uncharacterized protein LOC106161972 n=1 Tax=Lingula anatina TaxID=7574 RepID=A0A1S3I9G9_LINAN|nr:uncharacterized protein LOC106161972 [Lingula anatina]|eukprot:XP_013394506.1 uncharacterized protein LOC106161972 [Lingula anatina]